MSILKKLSLTISLVFWMTVQASAVDIKAAMIVSFSGTVEIFSALNAEAAAPTKSFVIYDGQKYLSRRVQSGVKVFPGDILRSGNDGKMKLIYDNGDVFILGSATAFIVPQKIEKGASPEIDSELLYGKIRALIEKKGPLSGLKIKTKTIVSGVRGTDLSISYNPMTLKTQVSVLRGEVEVTRISEVETQQAPLSVKTGQKAVAEEIAPNATKQVEKAKSGIQVLASTQQDLKQIEEQSQTPAPEMSHLKPEEKKQIAQLLETSKQKVLEDIRVSTPEVYQALQKQKATSVEEMNSIVAQILSKSAPKGSSKPKMSDFEKEEDIYQKYFKPSGP